MYSFLTIASIRIDKIKNGFDINYSTALTLILMLNEWKLLFLRRKTSISFTNIFTTLHKVHGIAFKEKVFIEEKKNFEIKLFKSELTIYSQREKRNNFASENLDFATMLLKVQSTWKPETLQRSFVLSSSTFSFFFSLSKGLPLNKHYATTTSSNRSIVKWTKNKKIPFSLFGKWTLMSFVEDEQTENNCTIVSDDWAIFISFPS